MVAADNPSFECKRSGQGRNFYEFESAVNIDSFVYHLGEQITKVGEKELVVSANSRTPRCCKGN